jgi:hypothetical protein
MSLFRESLRDFIQKQISIRQDAISAGNGELPDGELSKSRLNKFKNLQAGAHYAYREKSCTIRLASLVDIMEDIGLDLGVNNGSSRSRVRFEDYNGSTLSRNFILQGGVLSDYTTNLPVDPIDNMGPFLPGEEPSSTPKSRTLKTEIRGGFPSRKKINLSYGDPSVAAEPLGGDDGYGAVPMPGIVDAQIKTDSFYGSLRRAKINFVCHNLRQLEILELLYMRPGYPVLMEWGWSPYIDNEGKIENSFPSISDSDDFFDDKKVTQSKLEQEIIQLKETTNGNYDGFVGFVFNFNYESRADGGFNCVTEVISMGEVLDSLKIPQLDFSIIDNNLFNELDDKEKDKYIFNTSLGVLLKDIGDVVLQVDKEEEIKENVQASPWTSAAVPGGQYIADTQEEITEQRLIQEFRDSLIGIRGKLKEAMGDVVASTAFIEKHKIIKNRGESDNSGIQSSEGYIRWDAFCSLINEFVIPPNEKGGKPFFLEVSRFLTQEYGSITIDPILYCDVTPDFYDVSCDPKTCILPHQFNNFSDDEANLSLSEKVAGILSVDFNPFLTLEQKWKLEAAIWGAERTIDVDADLKDLDLSETIARRRIGNIYVGYSFLVDTFKKTFKGDRNTSLGKFLNNILKGLNEACPTHNFGFRIDPERTNLIQVVDLPIGPNDLQEVDYNSLFKFNVHSNDTIVRQFQFNSKVPDALKATVAINAQSGATADDLDSVTFAAFNRAIKSRLHSFSSKFSENERQNYSNLLGNKKSNEEILLENNKIIQEYYDKFFNYIDANEDDDLVATSRIKSAIERAQIANTANEKIDDALKGNQAVIPIDVTLSLDGISNLIMGNVFRVDETRLPKAYRDIRVGFVIVGEDQSINTNSDWVTNIRGHLILFPEDKEPKPTQVGTPPLPPPEIGPEILEPDNTATTGAEQSQQAQLDQLPTVIEVVGDYSIYQYPVAPFDIFIEPSLVDSDGNVIYEANTIIPQPIDVVKEDIEFYTAT